MKTILPILMLVIASCAVQEEPLVPGTHQKVDIILFVAPWCHSCRDELPKIEALLGSYDRERILVEAWVENGNQPGTQPTQANADEMKVTSGAKFSFYPDEVAWKKCREFFPHSSSLPAAVVTADDEKCGEGFCSIDHSVLKLFRAPYDPEALLLYANSQLQPK